jgi:hypothetical protein
MSSSRLIHLSGWAALVGFALIPILQVARVIAFPDTLTLSAISAMDIFFVLNLLIVIAMLLGLLGLTGIYVRQMKQIGVLGLVAFLVTFFGWALYTAFMWAETFIWPVFAHVAPQFMDHPDQNMLTALNASQTTHWLLIGAGWILFGAASLRAGLLPRGAAVLLIAGGVAAFVGNGVVGIPDEGILGALVSVVSLLGAVGLAWMGYAVWSRPEVAAESTAPMAPSGPSVANR